MEAWIVSCFPVRVDCYCIIRPRVERMHSTGDHGWHPGLAWNLGLRSAMDRRTSNNSWRAGAGVNQLTLKKLDFPNWSTDKSQN